MPQLHLRVTKKHLNMLKKKKNFNMSKKEHDDTSNHLVELHYDHLKDSKKVHNALMKGKGVRICPMHMTDCVYNGGSLWSKISHGISTVASNPITKAVAPILVNAGTTYATDNPQAGLLAGQVTNAALNPNQASSGSGLKRRGRKTGKGILDTVKKAVTDKTTKNIVNKLAPTISKIVADKTGSQLAGDVTNVGLNAYSGSGMKRRGKGVITSNINNFLHHGMGIDQIGLGGKHISVSNNVAQKMAFVRSFRGNAKLGGSFAPLGGN